MPKDLNDIKCCQKFSKQKYLLNVDKCPDQLGNKCSKETILNILSNEKYFSNFLIYQLACLVTIKEKSYAKLFSAMMSIELWPNYNQTADK